MLSRFRWRHISPITRLLAAIAVIGILAVSCGSGGDKNDDTPSSTSGPDAATSGASALIPGRPLSGPASAPAGPPRELPNPPNAGSIVCTDAPVIHDFVGLPADIDHWLVASSTDQAAIGDGGAHPGGWRYLALPERVQLRDAAPTDRRSDTTELATLDVPPLQARALDGRTFSMRPVVAMLASLDSGSYDAMIIPLDDSSLYGGWSTSAVLYERRDGSLGAVGNCPVELARSLNEVIAAARRADMQGTSTQILTSLSNTEIEQLLLGAYDR